jgi:hypothetical protein
MVERTEALADLSRRPMARPNSRDPIEPMDLANMRQNGVRARGPLLPSVPRRDDHQRGSLARRPHATPLAPSIFRVRCAILNRSALQTEAHSRCQATIIRRLPHRKSATERCHARYTTLPRLCGRVSFVGEEQPTRLSRSFSFDLGLLICSPVRTRQSTRCLRVGRTYKLRNSQ